MLLRNVGSNKSPMASIPGSGILHSHRHENLKSYIAYPAGLCSGDVMCLL
jgi:hypothetical protein